MANARLTRDPGNERITLTNPTAEMVVAVLETELAADFAGILGTSAAVPELADHFTTDPVQTADGV